jgi:hypothetical protein
MYSDKEIQISPAEWQIWRNMPTTIAIFNALMDERSIIVQQLAFGETLEKVGSEVKETALAVGTVQGLTIILEDIELTINEQYREAEERKQKEREEIEYE